MVRSKEQVMKTFRHPAPIPVGVIIRSNGIMLTEKVRGKAGLYYADLLNKMLTKDEALQLGLLLIKAAKS